MLKNILINLLTNAIKFSNEGSPIIINSRMQGKTATISVSDSGIGISPADQEHLFSSFFRGRMPQISREPGWGCILLNDTLTYWVEIYLYKPTGKRNRDLIYYSSKSH
jgi:K+-sensing histidine kinase KdpD